jgi:DNA-binding beta-propeller fold protein YncE
MMKAPTAVLSSMMAACVAIGVSARPAGAQIAVSANDTTLVLQDGAQVVARNPAADTVTVVDLGTTPARVLGQIEAPASVIGPPQSVAIAPDAAIALVTSSTKTDPADPAKTVPDDRVTVIDLTASPMAAIATLHTGAGASGVSFNRAGTLALVANRTEGTISVLTVQGKTVRVAGKVDLGAPASGPSHVVITPDGRRALVTRNSDSRVSILAIDGTSVTVSGEVTVGLQPYGIDVAPSGDVAIAANIGVGATGGVDTVAVIDLAHDPVRTVEQVAVGPTPEGLAISPDGRYVALTVMNGTNTPAASPLHHDFGLLRIFALDGHTLRPVADAHIGQWCQGVAWGGGSRSLVTGCMVDKALFTFTFDGRTLTPAGRIPVPGGPAGLRSAER